MAKITKPSTKQIADPNTGAIHQDWDAALGRAMDAVSGPFPLRTFINAQLPSASKWQNHVVHSTDTGLPLFSDGTHWKKFDGTIVA